MVMLLVALLVVLPAVLLALLMSGNTRKLNSSQLSPTTNNFLCQYPTLFLPYLAFTENFWFLISNLYFMWWDKRCIFVWAWEHWAHKDWLQLHNHTYCKSDLKFILARWTAWGSSAMSSVTINLQVGDSSCTPNKPNDRKTQITFKVAGSHVIVKVWEES